MIDFIFNETVSIKRRIDSASASRDVLNNPVYGTPTVGWSTIYTNLPCRLDFSQKKIEFAPTGERIKPYGTMYFDVAYTLFHEDRVITTDGIEYVVVSLQEGFTTPQVQDHWESQIELP